MDACINCFLPVQEGVNICPACINNWPVVKLIVLDRLNTIYGTPDAITAVLALREYKRLYRYWIRSRADFSREVNSWYDVIVP